MGIFFSGQNKYGYFINASCPKKRVKCIIPQEFPFMMNGFFILLFMAPIWDIKINQYKLNFEEFDLEDIQVLKKCGDTKFKSSNLTFEQSH